MSVFCIMNRWPVSPDPSGLNKWKITNSTLTRTHWVGSSHSPERWTHCERPDERAVIISSWNYVTINPIKPMSEIVPNEHEKALEALCLAIQGRAAERISQDERFISTDALTSHWPEFVNNEIGLTNDGSDHWLWRLCDMMITVPSPSPIPTTMIKRFLPHSVPLFSPFLGITGGLTSGVFTVMVFWFPFTPIKSGDQQRQNCDERMKDYFYHSPWPHSVCVSR